MPRYDDLQDVLAAAKPADILLTNRPRSKVSTLIRLLSGSPVSHAILALGSGQFVMAHRPTKDTDTVIQRYNAEQLQEEAWNRMYCYRHQALDSELDVDGGEGAEPDHARTKTDAVSKILSTAERFTDDTQNYKFATTDMIIGAALASARPAAWVLRVAETLPGMGEMFAELRRLLAQHAGGEAKLFCSEFVSRCFIDAATEHRQALIDTSFMIMGHWAAILSSQEATRSLTPPSAGPARTALDDPLVLRGLVELDELQQPKEVDELVVLPDVDELEGAIDRQASMASAPDAPLRRSAWLHADGRETVRGITAEQEQMMSELHEMREVLASFDWLQPRATRRSRAQPRGPDIADFITPVDLLRSPSLRAIAWWDATAAPPEW